MKNQTICLLNDSFPPLIDGVSNVVVNYAKNIEAAGDHAIVVTPHVPDADDSEFSFPVLRYPSIDTRKMVGYVAGVPFAPETMVRLQKEKPDLLHLHCPMTSAFLARQVRDALDLPLILTWHTKYDIDIANAIHSKVLQEEAIRVLIQNVNACDEVWTVSRGAGENLRSLGYEGEYIVMDNGVDLPPGPAPEADVASVCASYDLPEGVPVFLFVGRLMWYKGLRIILDALKTIQTKGYVFRMVFVGGGGDEKEVRAYTEELGLSGDVIFTGAVRDRNALRAWYSRADLFLFPSTFDTNGLVVREAAACHTASILIADSCASEGVTDDRNGFLIEENADAMAAKLEVLCAHPEKMKEVGICAGSEIYLSWEDAVKRAQARYEIVIDKFKAGEYRHRQTSLSEFVKGQGAVLEALSQLQSDRLDFMNGVKKDRKELLGNLRNESEAWVKNVRNESEEWAKNVRNDGQEMLSNLASERDMWLDAIRMEADDWRDMMHAVRDFVKGEIDL
ncbi:MAG: glycosyltransferase [Lachnospiraceae bacterium]|nr:glycosyltransferase [Lachnospiraceae bacterium]